MVHKKLDPCSPKESLNKNARSKLPKKDACSKQPPKKDPCSKKPTKEDSKPKPQKEATKKSATMIEFPHFLRIIGPKHIRIMMQFAPSAIFYGLTSLILATYMCEWKAVLQYLPYYNGKYLDENETAPPKQDEEKQEENAPQNQDEGSVPPK